MFSINKSKPARYFMLLFELDRTLMCFHFSDVLDNKGHIYLGIAVVCSV